MSLNCCTQFATVVEDIKAEKQKNLDILDKLSKGKPILDVTKAANTATAEAEKRYIVIFFHGNVWLSAGYKHVIILV